MSASVRKKHYQDLVGSQENENSFNDDFGLIIGAIKRVGPRNCSLISRLTSIPIETVRHKIEKQLVKKGFRFHVNVDYNKLGLIRYWATLNFSDQYSELATKILDMLSRMGYLIYFGRIVPQGIYALIIALPVKAIEEYTRFLNSLIDLGILDSYEIDELAHVQQHFIKHEYYNFKKGTWNVDWAELEQSKADVPKTVEDHAYEMMADEKDLLILEQLQFDPMASFAKIARELNTNQKTVRYHYLKHIVGRRLVKEYIVRWQASLGKDERRSILALVVQLRNITSGELSTVQEVFLRLPFTWFDAFSDDRSLYLAYVTLPMAQYVNVLEFLRRNIPKQCLDNLKVSLIDMSCSMGYTIPYEMFDEKWGWVFDAERTLEKFSSEVKAMKQAELESKIKRE
jgi:DNA-binding Lrp family transcriptional regulator